MCTGTLLQNHIFSKWDIWVGRVDQTTFLVVDFTFKQLKKKIGGSEKDNLPAV